MTRRAAALGAMIAVLLVLITGLVITPRVSPRPLPVATASPSPVVRDDSTVQTAVAPMPATANPAAIGIRLADPIIGGRATWYAASGMIAAAGPALRHYLGARWRGSLVAVELVGSGRAVVVRLTDWCLCTGHGGRLIDLSDDAFVQLAPLSRGVVAVGITRVVRDLPDLPATDTRP